MNLKLISDGTVKGTKIIDEDTGEQLPNVSRIRLVIDANHHNGKITVEMTGIPVELTSVAMVNLHEYVPPNCNSLDVTKQFNKNIKVNSNGKTINTLISDADTDKQIAAVQKIEWEGTSSGTLAKVSKIKLNDSDWD